jgi:DNA-binding response OmpR family regulator
MNLKSLLMSSDEKTVRVLRRVLSDLEIETVHCEGMDDAVRRITRHRYEAVIVDGTRAKDASEVLQAVKAAPVNKRALTIALMDANAGMKAGFEMGAHFVLHKPFAVERAKASFRAVRALMKKERRLQMRVPIEIPVDCVGTGGKYQATTLDLCAGGMAIRFKQRIAKESPLRFSLELPNTNATFSVFGELAWEGAGQQAGVRFTDVKDDQRKLLDEWLSRQVSEPEADDPPVCCKLTDLSLGGCYLKTVSPFPRATRVILDIKTGDVEVRAKGVVRVAHAEVGMGVEFQKITDEQQDQAQKMIAMLKSDPEKSPEAQVEPDGLETPEDENGNGAHQAKSEDALVELFRRQFGVPVETFMAQMKEQREQLVGSE